jgi:hypothetical protein
MLEVIYADSADLLTTCRAAKEADMDEDDVRLEDAVIQASEIMFTLTGRQFLGTQTATVRPCMPCCCTSRCRCLPYRVNLGFWPVTSVLNVWYDGETQEPDLFHVDHYRYLVRNDGEAFPENRANNMWADTGGDYDNLSDGFVFEVEIEYGLQPPRLVQRATRDLACKLLTEFLCDSGDCEKDDRITSISREGVSYTLMDPIQLLRQGGGTGIYSVDLAVKTFNPSGLQSPTIVWTPDLSTSGHRTVR